MGALKPRADADAALLAADAAAPLDPAERLASLRADYDADYFISGRGEMRAYDPDCVFADPYAPQSLAVSRPVFAYLSMLPPAGLWRSRARGLRRRAHTYSEQRCG